MKTIKKEKRMTYQFYTVFMSYRRQGNREILISRYGMYIYTHTYT